MSESYVVLLVIIFGWAILELVRGSIVKHSRRKYQDIIKHYDSTFYDSAMQQVYTKRGS